MNRQASRDSQATFSGARHYQRNTPSPTLDDQQYSQQPNVNLKDFETFEPKEMDDSSNASSILVPQDMQRRFEHDMHLMLDDLDMPNQSMTLSSLNHSQFQGRSTRSYLSSLSNNQVAGGHQSSVESSQLPSARQHDTNSNLTMSNSHSQFGTEEKIGSRHHEDSPDFNRPQESLVSVTDELTVSKSDLGVSAGYMGGGKSYRDNALDVVQPPLLRNQNRTFADSVIDHQLNGVVNLGNYNKTAMKSGGSVSKTNALGQSNTVDVSRQFGKNKVFSPYLDSGNTIDEPALDQSDDISELDLLTRTQISHNLNGVIDPNARSRIIIPQLLQDSLSQSQITVPGSDPSNPHTKRTNNNIFRKMVDDASSLTFTPEKDGMSTNSINWQLKSHNPTQTILSSESTSQLNTDRELLQQMNPISQLKEKIKQSNIQKRQGSKPRDTELYEALEAQQPRETQHQPPHQLHNQNSQMHRTLQDLQAQNQELSDQNRQLAKTCEVYQHQISDLQKQTNTKAQSGSDLLRVRALEAARSELKELKQEGDERETRILQLEQVQIDSELSQREIQQKHSDAIDKLELLVEKQKIIIQGHKRESDSKVSKSIEDLQQALKNLDVSKQQQALVEQSCATQLRQMEIRLSQADQMLQQRDSELQNKALSKKKQMNEFTQMESHAHAIEIELEQWKQKCINAEEEVDLVRQRNTQNHQLSGVAQNTGSGKEFDQELRRMKDKHQAQIAKLSDENYQLQTGLKDKDALLKAYSQQSTNVQQNEVLDELCQILGEQSSNDLASHLHSLLDTQQSLQQQLTSFQTSKDQQVGQLTQKIKQQQTEIAHATDQARKAQQAASQADGQGPSNFTKNLLHQKDVDIQNLNEQLNQLQDDQWQTEQELKQLEAGLSMEREEKHIMQQELVTVRKGKQAAELTCTELKDKLRQELSKQHELRILASPSAIPTQPQSQSESNALLKQTELIQKVMSLRLVKDPLPSIPSQQTTDDSAPHIQAMAWLDTQGSLVTESLALLDKQIAQLNQQLKEVESNYQSQMKQTLSSKDDLESEMQSLLVAQRRSAEVVSSLEKQILDKQSVGSSRFLETLDRVIEGSSVNEESSDLVTQLKQRIRILQQQPHQNDLSQIMPDSNPLQDKSGKHEAMLFLTHLQPGALQSGNPPNILKTVDQHAQTDITPPAQDSHLVPLEQPTALQQQIESLKQELAQKQKHFQMLHTQLMSELQLNKDEAEIEASNFEQERRQYQQASDKVRLDCDRRLMQQQEQHDFRLQELEIDYQTKLEMDSINMSSARSQLKGEATEKVQQLRLELKQAGKELERVKKVQVDKMSKMQAEMESDKELKVQQMQERVEESEKQAKVLRKEAVDKATSTLRSDLLNKISELKNEHARSQAEWQRDRSKFDSAKLEQIEQLKSDLGGQSLLEVKEAKVIVERVWKKKLDDLKGKHEERLRDIDNELEEVKQSHREEIRKQNKQWQVKLTKLQDSYGHDEDELLPKKYTSAMTQVSPSQHQQQLQSNAYAVSKSVEVIEQTTPRSLRQSHQSSLKQQTPAPQCNCSVHIAQLHATNAQQLLFIEQLKINFEQELERQESLHLQNLSQKLKQTISTFEQLLSLELEKILITISFKSSDTGQPQSELNKKRSDINALIKQLYSKHKHDQKDLKKSFEIVKEKVSLVLQTLKQQLIAKYKDTGNARLQHTRSTIQIDDTDTESQVMSSQDTTLLGQNQNQTIITVERNHGGQRMNLQRQSTTSSADVNLTNNQSYSQYSPQELKQKQEVPKLQLQGRNSELKNYIELQEHHTFQDQNPMARLAPQSQNSKGSVVVEVEKVVRDLQMLFETTKMAKFCRVLLGPQQQNQSMDEVSQLHSARSSTQDSVVSAYRDLLNNFFRLVAKLNQASDQICQDQEVFRLRLLNVDLKQQVSQLMKDQSGVVTRGLVQEVITFYQKQPPQQTPRIKTVLDSLEHLHFQISKNQFKLNQLADLFTKEGAVNQNIREVLLKCDEFSTMDQFLESSFYNQKISPELMSPDETAQLIANVIQKLPTGNKQFSVSSEDILKQALQICHDQQHQSIISMPPLQRLPNPHHRLGTTAQTINQTIDQTTIQTQNSGISRSRSQGGLQQAHLNMPRQMMLNSGSLYQTVEPTAAPQIVPSSHHQGNQRYQSHQLQKPQQNERYVQDPSMHMREAKQQSRAPIMSQTMQSQEQEESQEGETDFMIEEGDSVGVNPQHSSSLDEELACAQTNVNQLFEKLKGSKFNTLQY